MFDTVGTIFIFVMMLTVLVLAHEAGHFFTAKAFGVKVNEFGIGYPPRLFAVKRGDTEYSVNLLPLGGFVKLAGEEDPTAPGSLASKSHAKRITVLASGAIINALLPLIFFSAAFALPHDVAKGPTEVVEVSPGSPAEAAGILPGDVITRFNGRELINNVELGRVIILNLGEEVPVEVRHADGTVETVTVTPRWDPPEGQGAVGIRTRTGHLEVVEVSPGSPAAVAGISPGDDIISFDSDAPINEVQQGSTITINPEGETSILVRKADGTVVKVSVTPRSDLPDGQGTIGLRVQEPDINFEKVTEPIFSAIGHGVREAGETLVLFKNSILLMVFGGADAQVSGPVGIAQMTGEVARAGFSPLLEFTAFLSLNLAILNLLPIPALDGGRIAFVVVEWARRGKRIDPQLEGKIHFIGFVILIMLIIMVTFQDIVRIVGD